MWIACSASPLTDQEGARYGWIILFRNMTRFKEMEEAMRRSERLAALGKMAAGIAHEIRNPLASMSGSIELLKQDMEDTSQNSMLMDIVLRETDRLNDLIENFLRYARLTPPSKLEFDIVDSIEETLRMLEAGGTARKNIRIKTRFFRPLTLYGDERQIKQVIWNLLKNSIEAMDQGGTLNVTASPMNSQDLEGTRIEISDTGTGIPVEVREKIFEPFFTTKEDGIGLGMATVFRIVEAHGGIIEVSNNKDGGTTVTLKIYGRSSAHQPDLPGDTRSEQAEG